MQTAIYIDGFNLYYGALKETPYKWFDIVKLFEHIAKEQLPNSEIVSVKFFTAPIRAKIARRGMESAHSQSLYHKALKNKYPNQIEIINGYFTVEPDHLPKYQNPMDKEDRVSVWRLEEKQTDVNIALQMYRDARKGIEHSILVSNDSDLIPALHAIQEDYPAVKIGTVIPRIQYSNQDGRTSNKGLTEVSHWQRG